VARFHVALVCLVALPRVLSGQADTARADTGALGIRPASLLPSFQLREPEVLRAPWMGAPRRPPALRAATWDSTVAALLDSARVQRAAALRALVLYGMRLEEEPPAEPGARPPDQGLLGLSKKYADLALDGQVNLELRTDRLRNERCSPALLLEPNSGCRSSFKAPRLDNQFTARSGGIIGQRIHLNVDYDNKRDFAGNNNVQVYYEGLEDEIVRKIEIGTVTFQPPPSKFITAAIPANNFGVNARFEVGPLQIQTLAASQKGSQVAERTYTIGQTTSQPEDRQVRDLDFESGRFFWVVDPTTVPNYPAIDILSLSTTDLSVDRPEQVQVYRYRAAVNQSGSNPNVSGITARAQSSDGRQIQGPVRWELLVRGTDYYLDPSGLWIALSTKLDRNVFLAVSYRTASGVMVGSLPVRDVPAAGDSLRLIVDPQKGPEFESFRHEMRQIYRVAGSDLDPSSLQVNLTLNRSERPLSGSATYLGLLGLATATDPNVLDQENRLFPRARDPEALQIFHESYIVFPHLRPFADSTRLTPAELSDSLYKVPLELLLSQGPPSKYQLRLRYNSASAGDRSTLSLGALQIRDGSEQLFISGRRLARGVDYSISYELGQVTFLNPDALFGTGTAQVTARFEEQTLFAVAPTTILGLTTRYSLGEVGAVNLVGLYQRQQSAFNRPPLGFEATANLIGGVTTELHFKPQAVSRFLGHLTSSPTAAPSLLDFNGEFAMTRPDPNRSGQAYMEEFEADAGIEVPLRESLWGFGSIPQQSLGVEDLGFAGGFDPADAVALTWQNLVPSANGTAVELRSQDIDTLIQTAGRSDRPETVMFLTLHADTAGGLVQNNNASRWSLPQRLSRPRWRSMVTPLSATGVDLTQSEYLEFWVFQPGTRTVDSAGVRLMLDLGTVNEDALAIAPESLLVSGADSTYTGRQLVGLGRLDSERNSSTDIFNAAVDDIGILGDRPDQLFEVGAGFLDHPALCHRTLSSAVPVFPWGDLSSRCTNGNGTLDAEDLNGDGVLNASGPNESVFRYVVGLQPGSKYYVRDGVATLDPATGLVSKWELYRVPIRTPDVTIGTPNLRLIQHLRMTVVAPPDNGTSDVVARFALARMHLVGSSWARRSETPIAGLSGSTGKGVGEVIASVISTANSADLGYVSPPGVGQSVSQRGGDRSSLGTQINEKSLRVIARGLDVGDRAEAYLRFPSGPQNLLNYRELRVWARGRGAGWEEGDLQAFLKLGSDNRNFYLYRSGAHSTTWEPEFTIDLQTWRRLRADLETRWLRGDPPSGSDQCGGDPGAYVACEGPYLVHLADPGVNPPNLAAVQEVSAGIIRVGQAVPLQDAELWVDDIRLTRPVQQTGTAMAFDARLAASDVGSVAASFSRQTGQFRQLNQDPSYQTTGTFQLTSNWRLNRFLPTSLGLTIPFSVSYVRTNVDPQLLAGTDLQADALSGLRRPNSWTATYTLELRRSERGRNWLVRGLVDPLGFAATLVQGRSRTELSNAQSDASTVALSYNLQLQRRGPRLPFAGLVKALPKWIRESEGGKGLANAMFSLVPSNIRWSSGLSRDESNYSSFSVPVSRSDDSLVRPALSLSHLWRNSGSLTWQPLGMLSLNGDLTSTRDLRVYPDSTPIGRLSYLERRFLAGIPVGVERDRVLTTALSLTPRVSSWLRPRFITTSSFVLSRALSSRPPVRLDGDSGGFILPQTLNNTRGREMGVSLDLSRLLRQVGGDSSGLAKIVARIRPLDISSQLNRGSTYDLTAFDPDLGFMLGMGGLDRFLGHAGEDARGAAETRTATLTSSADLPLGLSAGLSYSLTKTNRFQQVPDGFAETTSRQREWPVANLRWTHPFKGGPLSLVAASTEIRQREGTSVQPSTDQLGAVSATTSSVITPNLQVAFRNGLALTMGLSTRRQRTDNNGNATLLDQNDFTGSLNYSFRLPRSISPSRKPLRSSLTAFVSNTQTCLDRADVPTCVVISDVRRQEMRGGFDTDLLGTVSGGLQFGYSINDARQVSRRTSQIFIQMSLQLSLYAGDYR
jgi:motility/secretion related protein SprA